MLQTRIPWWVGWLSCAAVCLAGCGNDEPSYRPNIVLISVDTLRADHLPTYGYERPTAPRIDELARGATVFDRCYAEASHTLLTHSTLLTGVYPETHGMTSSRSTLSDEIPTVAETLRDHGFRTGAFVNSAFLHPKFKLDRGFDEYDYYPDQRPAGSGDDRSFGRSAGQTNRLVFAWLDEAPGEPFFLFVHYFDVHSDWDQRPYEAPAGYRERFEIDRPPGFVTGDGEVSASRYLLRRNEQGMSYSEPETAYLRSLYDGGIAYADSEIGALLDRLRDLQLLDRSIVILLSDHGEEFQEHGKLLHSQVYEELVRVPLVISFPEDGPDVGGAQGRRVGSLVQLSDIMPTLLAYLNIDPPPTLQGTSLLPLLARGEPTRQYAYFRNKDGSQYGVRDARWKLLVHGKEDPEIELFDLDADPGERRNLAAQHAGQVPPLLKVLSTWRKETVALRPRRTDQTDLDVRTRKQLEALGYVGD